MATVDFHGSHDVGFRADHQVTLDPIVLFPDLSVFVVEPAGETAGGKAGRIHSEVRLYRLEGQTGLCDESLQDGSQVGILKVIGDAVKVRHLSNVSAPNV